MIRWETCKQDFKFDGAWLDIYVFGTTIEDWQSLFNVLQASYTFAYSVDGKPQQFPKTIEEVFSVRKSACPALSFLVGRISVACHFFHDKEIEFDIDPRGVTSQAELDVLLNFLCLIGNTIHRSVILTPENGPEHPILTYNSESKTFLFHSVN